MRSGGEHKAQKTSSEEGFEFLSDRQYFSIIMAGFAKKQWHHVSCKCREKNPELAA